MAWVALAHELLWLGPTFFKILSNYIGTLAPQIFFLVWASKAKKGLGWWRQHQFCFFQEIPLALLKSYVSVHHGEYSQYRNNFEQWHKIRSCVIINLTYLKGSALSDPNTWGCKQHINLWGAPPGCLWSPLPLDRWERLESLSQPPLVPAWLEPCTISKPVFGHGCKHLEFNICGTMEALLCGY